MERGDVKQTFKAAVSGSECNSCKLRAVFCFSAHSSQVLKGASGCRLVYLGSLAVLHDGAALFNR